MDFEEEGSCGDYITPEILDDMVSVKLEMYKEEIISSTKLVMKDLIEDMVNQTERNIETRLEKLKKDLKQEFSDFDAQSDSKVNTVKKEFFENEAYRIKQVLKAGVFQFNDIENCSLDVLSVLDCVPNPQSISLQCAQQSTPSFKVNVLTINVNVGPPVPSDSFNPTPSTSLYVQNYSLSPVDPISKPSSTVDVHTSVQSVSSDKDVSTEEVMTPLKSRKKTRYNWANN